MKLTKEKANKILRLAYKHVRDNRDLNYRLGQAIANLLHHELVSHLIGTDQDFFLDTDETIVIRKFYHNCVEGF